MVSVFDWGRGIILIENKACLGHDIWVQGHSDEALAVCVLRITRELVRG